jgi:hypothetical protein
VAPAYEPLAWLAVLGLTALRSPFLPTYGGFPGAWLGALLLAICWDGRAALVDRVGPVGDPRAHDGGADADSIVGCRHVHDAADRGRSWGWR